MTITTNSRLLNIALGIVVGLVLALAGIFIWHIFTPGYGPYEAPYIEPKGFEYAEMRSLRLQRYSWLFDGCPEPPVAVRYADGFNSQTTNYTYPGTFTVTNLPGALNMGKQTYRGLFATKQKDWDYTLVIATTGDIFAINNSGNIILLEGSFN